MRTPAKSNHGPGTSPRRAALRLALAVPLALAAIPASSPAQPPDAVFGVDYYAHADTGPGADATVRITNPGVHGALSPSGDLCALIYVFTADQQMAECCGCPVTPNGLRTLSVGHDLTDNPLTGDAPTTGALKIVSSTPSPTGACDPASPVPTPQLIAWATHVQGGASVAVTETAFEPTQLSDDELGRLKDTCGGIVDNGSGYGVCSCGTEQPPTTSTTVTTTTLKPTVPSTSTTTTTRPPPDGTGNWNYDKGHDPKWGHGPGGHGQG